MSTPKKPNVDIPTPAPVPAGKRRRARAKTNVTAMERAQFARGFASVRIAAFKTLRHRSSLTRLCREQTIQHEFIHNSYYLHIAELVQHLGKESSKALGLDNWETVLDDFDAKQQ